MSINILGRFNFGALGAYVWKSATDFLQFQTYFEAYVKEMMTGRKTSGILYGGQVTVVSGLQISVAAGGALMPNGQLVTWDVQTLTLGTANATNPRIDRIELSYALANSTSVTNTLNASVVRDWTHATTAVINAGTPAGSPAANARGTTGGVANLSLALVTVAANQTVLISGNISQVEDTAWDVASDTFGDSTHLFRYNRTSGTFQVSYNGGGSWRSIGLLASTLSASLPVKTDASGSLITQPLIPPAFQKFTSGSGTYIPSWAFICSSANATVGATYTNNGQTFTVSQTISGQTVLVCTAASTTAPSASGTLTKATGTGDATITFLAAQQPISIEFQMVGAGGGGGGGGTAIGTAATAGGNSTFGSSTAGGGGLGGHGQANGPGGAGGTYTLATGVLGFGVNGGPGGGGGGYINATGQQIGPMGGIPAFGGPGSGLIGGSSTTSATNSGAGGGGGSCTQGTAVNGQTGGGGGAGAYLFGIINNNSSAWATSIAYGIGLGGNAGVAGTNGSNGSAGASGGLYIRELFQ